MERLYTNLGMKLSGMKNSSKAQLIVTLGLFTLLYGFGAGALILREPDTCFLLSLGRWICWHHALPVSDPFSYTFSLYPQPLGLIVYQWLTEVIFFSIYRAGGAIALSLFGSTILLFSFFIIPWKILNRFPIGLWQSTIIVLLLAAGTIDRILLKPEIFSYLLLSLYIFSLSKVDTTKGASIDWKLIAFLALLMLLWANLHTGFVIGLVFLFLLAIKDLLHWLVLSAKNQKSAYPLQWLLAFITALTASLITPYGLKLWQYIPHLYFHPINSQIIELQPLSLNMLSHNFPLLISFVTLSGLSLIQLIRKVRSQPNQNEVFYIVLALIGFIMGISCLRLVTFGLLLMLPLIASGFSVKSDSSTQKAFSTTIPFIALIPALIGCFIVCTLTSQNIPSDSKIFIPPFKALNFIASREFSGNLLNDPCFGDVLMWNSTKCPPLFIDTRFDAYPEQISKDYVSLRDCKNGWQKLIENYNISWIFIPPSSSLAKQISNDARWQLLFKDQSSCIFSLK